MACLKSQSPEQQAAKLDDAEEQCAIKGRQAKHSMHSPANLSDAKDAQLRDIHVQLGDLVILCLRLTVLSVVGAFFPFICSFSTP